MTPPYTAGRCSIPYLATLYRTNDTLLLLPLLELNSGPCAKGRRNTRCCVHSPRHKFLPSTSARHHGLTM